MLQVGKLVAMLDRLVAILERTSLLELLIVVVVFDCQNCGVGILYCVLNAKENLNYLVNVRAFVKLVPHRIARLCEWDFDKAESETFSLTECGAYLLQGF